MSDRDVIVVGADEAPRARRQSLVPVAAAVALLAATVAALHATTVRTADPEPAAGLHVVEATAWEPPADRSQWGLSRIYTAPDGRSLSFTVQRGAGNDVPNANTTVAGVAAALRAEEGAAAGLLEWNHGGFGYTAIGVGLAPGELRAIAEGVVLDPTGLGTLVVPRPGHLPAGMMLLAQRSGPAAGPGAGGGGTRTVLEDDAGRRITVTATQDAIVTAAHLSGLLRLTARGSDELVFTFPGTGSDSGLRWLVSDRGDATVLTAGVGATTEELREAAAAAGA